MSAKETVELIRSGLRLGIKAYDSALHLTELGHTIPELREFEQRVCRQRCSVSYLQHGGDRGRNSIPAGAAGGEGAYISPPH